MNSWLVEFHCLMAYQPSWVIRGQKNYSFRTVIVAFVCLHFALLDTRLLNSLEELCIMWVAAVNSFARVLNPIYIYIYIYVCVCVCVCVFSSDSLETLFWRSSDAPRTLFGHSSDSLRTLFGHSSDSLRTLFRHSSDSLRAFFGHSSDSLRTLFGHSSDSLRTLFRHSSDSLRAFFGHSLIIFVNSQIFFISKFLFSDLIIKVLLLDPPGHFF